MKFTAAYNTTPLLALATYASVIPSTSDITLDLAKRDREAKAGEVWFRISGGNPSLNIPEACGYSLSGRLKAVVPGRNPTCNFQIGSAFCQITGDINNADFKANGALFDAFEGADFLYPCRAVNGVSVACDVKPTCQR